MNIVVLNGNLTRDPETRSVGDTQVANFSIAVNRNFKRANGEWDQEVTFVDCEAWDSGAQRLADTYKKGDPILIQGALKLDTWETDGEKRSKLKVRVSSFNRLHRAPASDKSSNNTSQQEAVGVGAESYDPEIPF